MTLELVLKKKTKVSSLNCLDSSIQRRPSTQEELVLAFTFPKRFVKCMKEISYAAHNLVLVVISYLLLLLVTDQIYVKQKDQLGVLLIHCKKHTKRCK